jgi:hypothetical protein
VWPSAANSHSQTPPPTMMRGPWKAGRDPSSCLPGPKSGLQRPPDVVKGPSLSLFVDFWAAFKFSSDLSAMSWSLCGRFAAGKGPGNNGKTHWKPKCRPESQETKRSAALNHIWRSLQSGPSDTKDSRPAQDEVLHCWSGLRLMPWALGGAQTFMLRTWNLAHVQEVWEAAAPKTPPPAPQTPQLSHPPP